MIEQIVWHPEKDFELRGLVAPDELQVNTVMQKPRKPNPGKPKPTFQHCKKPSHYRNHSNGRKTKLKTI